MTVEYYILARPPSTDDDERSRDRTVCELFRERTSNVDESKQPLFERLTTTECTRERQRLISP